MNKQTENFTKIQDERNIRPSSFYSAVRRLLVLAPPPSEVPVSTATKQFNTVFIIYKQNFTRIIPS